MVQSDLLWKGNYWERNLMGWWLDSVILKVLSSLSDSMILCVSYLFGDCTPLSIMIWFKSVTVSLMRLKYRNLLWKDIPPLYLFCVCFVCSKWMIYGNESDLPSATNDICVGRCLRLGTSVFIVMFSSLFFSHTDSFPVWLFFFLFFCVFFLVSVLQEQASRLGVPTAILAAKNVVTNIERICQASASLSTVPLLNLDQRVREKVYIKFIKKTVMRSLTLNLVYLFW